jgi:hypothetical protein
MCFCPIYASGNIDSFTSGWVVETLRQGSMYVCTEAWEPENPLNLDVGFLIINKRS